MKITLLDGGMGQELMARSKAAATPLWSAHTMLREPELVTQIHSDFFKAGAQVATTNSYILHRDRLAQNDAEDQFEPLNLLACELACKARDAFGGGQVAGGMGPNGRSYRPDLAHEIEQAAQAFAEIATIQSRYVDLFLLETMASVKQAEGAILGAQVPGKPVWVSLTVDDSNGELLRSGEPLSQAISMAESHGVDAILINCSTPEAVSSAMTSMKSISTPYGAYANGFTKISEQFKEIGATVDNLISRQDLTPSRYADFVHNWVDSGASIVGGCCEVGPAHIQELAQRFATG